MYSHNRHWSSRPRAPETGLSARASGPLGMGGWGCASLSAGRAWHGPASADSPRGAHDLYLEHQRFGLCFGQRDASALAGYFIPSSPARGHLARLHGPNGLSGQDARAPGCLAFGAGREILGLARTGRQPAFLYAPQAPRPPPCRLTVAFHAHKRAGPRNPPRHRGTRPSFERPATPDASASSSFRPGPTTPRVRWQPARYAFRQRRSGPARRQRECPPLALPGSSA